MVERGIFMGYYNKFMQIGVERQNDSVTVDEATRNYARSCECCMKRGCNFEYDCDLTCPITIAHRDKLDTILTLRQLEHERRVRNDELKKKVDECISMIKSIYEMAYCPSQIDEHNKELDDLVAQWLKLKGERYGNVK